MTNHSSVGSAVSLLLGGSVAAFAFTGTAAADDFFLKPGSLVISSSEYVNWQGAVARLDPTGSNPTQLANTNTATVSAVSDGNYVTVWANEVPDASFGVTSPISLTVMEPASGRELGRFDVPQSQVVTSFSSKSELALHYTRDWRGGHLVFNAYAGAGVGALDVSNADAVAGQDPTNPVSFAFGRYYAFHRTIVDLSDDGRLSYTPTENYGGNNGRAALLASNGLYYTVGNSNNGNADTFGSASNGTNPDVTQTTGVEVVTPIDGWSVNVAPAIPAVAAQAGHTPGSDEVNPLLEYGLGKKGADDKPGKDNNFRGITEYNGALYFTKGSGSNGVDTVYTLVNDVPQSPAGFIPTADTGPAAGNVLPTIANAGQQTIQIVNGFPTDSARATGGNFTPFAVFFANPTTMYVTDEGTGDSTDVAANAGLEKWVLNTATGSWSLAYTLQSGLIGQSYGPLPGRDGAWPAVTTLGLRNLAGRVNKNGTVTLWAATSTTDTNAANTDVGADPNEVVEITDQVSATSLPAGESFRVLARPVYGTVYRGVAYVPDEDHDRGHFGH
jgi:hypothetical protein